MDVSEERKTGFNVREHQEAALLAEFGEQETKTGLALLYDVGEKVGSVLQLKELVEQITWMIRRALFASASSVLLFDDQERELLFEVAEGPAGELLKQLRLNAQSGIAGWVVRHGKPLIVNDVAKDTRFSKDVDEITGYVTRSIICAPLVVQRKIIGVIEVLNKLDGSDFSEQDLEILMPVAATTAIAVENIRLQQSTVDAYKSTIKALAAAIDAKDPYTCGHSQRVTEYALLAADSLSLSREDLETIEYAGILHDIGKIGIADSVLNKSGVLTSEERDMICLHPLIGATILKEIPFLEKARGLVLHHQERYDGNGYPDKLRGEAIPMGARLLAVADAFDAMTTDRSYRAALTTDYAINELYKLSGTQFCPVAVKAFISGFHSYHSPRIS